MYRFLFDRWSFVLFVVAAMLLAAVIFLAGKLIERGPGLLAAPSYSSQPDYINIASTPLPDVQVNAPKEADNQPASTPPIPKSTPETLPPSTTSLKSLMQNPQAKPTQKQAAVTMGASGMKAPVDTSRAGAGTAWSPSGSWSLKQRIERKMLEAYLAFTDRAELKLDLLNIGRTIGGANDAGKTVNLGFLELSRGTDLKLAAKFDRSAGDDVARLQSLRLRSSRNMSIGGFAVKAISTSPNGNLCFDLDADALNSFKEQLCIYSVQRSADGITTFRTFGEGSLAALSVHPLRILPDGTVEQYRSEGVFNLGLFKAWCPVAFAGKSNLKLPGGLSLKNWPPALPDILALLPDSKSSKSNSNETGSAKDDALQIADIKVRLSTSVRGRSAKLFAAQRQFLVKQHEMSLNLEGRLDSDGFHTITTRNRDANEITVSFDVAGSVSSPELGTAQLSNIAQKFTGKVKVGMALQDPAVTQVSVAFNSNWAGSVESYNRSLGANGATVATDGGVDIGVQAKGELEIMVSSTEDPYISRLQIDEKSRFNVDVPGPISIASANRLFGSDSALRLPQRWQLQAPERASSARKGKKRRPEKTLALLEVDGTFGTLMAALDAATKDPAKNPLFSISTEKLHLNAISREAIAISVGDEPQIGATMVHSTMRPGANLLVNGDLSGEVTQDVTGGQWRLRLADTVLKGNLRRTEVFSEGVLAKIPDGIGLTARLDGNMHLNPVRLRGGIVNVALAVPRNQRFSAESIDGKAIAGTILGGGKVFFNTGSMRPLVRTSMLETPGFSDGKLGGSLSGSIDVNVDSSKIGFSPVVGRVKTRLNSSFGVRFDSAQLLTSKLKEAVADPIKTKLNFELELERGATLRLGQGNGEAPMQVSGPIKLQLEAFPDIGPAVH
jgi:hypothetical protein